MGVTGAIQKADKFLSTPSARRATEQFSSLIDFCKFLSTPSARRATIHLVLGYFVKDISIHALREEGDMPINYWIEFSLRFLSTPSARRATVTSP